MIQTKTLVLDILKDENEDDVISILSNYDVKQNYISYDYSFTTILVLLILQSSLISSSIPFETILPDIGFLTLLILVLILAFTVEYSKARVVLMSLQFFITRFCI